jgi:hypothetical protein
LGRINYREVILGAGRITWEQKVLWIPAFLMAASGVFYMGGIYSLGWSYSGDPGTQSFSVISVALQNLFQRSPLLSIVLLLLFVFILIFIAVMAQTIIMRGVMQARLGRGALKFGELLAGSLAYFWRVIGVAISWSLIITVILTPLICFGALIFSPALQSAAQGIASGSTIYAVILYLIIFLVSLVTNALMMSSMLAVIVEDKGVGGAISRGWSIFRQRLKDSLLVSTILTVINYLLSGLLVNLLIRYFVTNLAKISAAGLSPVSAALFVSLNVLLALAAVIIHVLVMVYYSGAWTLAFLQWTKPTRVSK